MFNRTSRLRIEQSLETGARHCVNPSASLESFKAEADWAHVEFRWCIEYELSVDWYEGLSSCICGISRWGFGESL